ncbi:uncharacterized protein Dana_GF27942, isoform B [Drosophila ananassae]|uniref:Uncharacterized protein, isoform B n=1 Tax=Drosophila ananassae TaxID=7217 RepID=A0A0P8Y0N2_DROAN|nr:uncharacterized protein Dana_GF27942, isoform B [Drosophila ananassae]
MSFNECEDNYSFYSFNDNSDDSLDSPNVSISSEDSLDIEDFDDDSIDTVICKTPVPSVPDSPSPKTAKNVLYKHSPLLYISNNIKKCFANDVKKQRVPEVHPSFKVSPLQKFSASLRVYFDKKDMKAPASKKRSHP